MKRDEERWYLRCFNIFEWNLVEKAQFIFLTSSIFALVISAALITIEYFLLLPGHDLDAQGALQLSTLAFIYMISALAFYALGSQLKKRKPNSIIYAHLAIQVYCIANTAILYYLGLFSLGTGIALSGGPIVGMILFPARVVFFGLINGIGLSIIAMTLSATGAIPYAPLLADPGSAHENLAWMLVSSLYMTPHLFLVVGVSIISILKWQEREQRVKFLSCTDVLTDVSNRRHLMDVFKEQIHIAKKKNQSISFLMVDLDHFKKINDLHGHQHGDEALKKAAKALQKSIRIVDHIGRYGGEEFGIILPNTHAETAMEIAERCRVQVERSQLKPTDQSSCKLTASIGIASLNFKDQSLEQTTDLVPLMESLLTYADQALYQAKELGRNRVIHYQQLK